MKKTAFVAFLVGISLALTTPSHACWGGYCGYGPSVSESESYSRSVPLPNGGSESYSRSRSVSGNGYGGYGYGYGGGTGQAVGAIGGALAGYGLAGKDNKLAGTAVGLGVGLVLGTIFDAFAPSQPAYVSPPFPRYTSVAGPQNYAQPPRYTAPPPPPSPPPYYQRCDGGFCVEFPR